MARRSEVQRATKPSLLRRLIAFLRHRLLRRPPRDPNIYPLY